MTALKEATPRELTLREAQETYGIDTRDAGDSYLVPSFGKYASNLAYLVPKWYRENVFSLFNEEKYDVIAETAKGNLALEKRAKSYLVGERPGKNFPWMPKKSTGLLYGEFFRSKKGGAMFRILSPEIAPHILVSEDWGGSRGDNDGSIRGKSIQNNLVYYRCASSGGGGMGREYFVIPNSPGMIEDAHAAEERQKNLLAALEAAEAKAALYRPVALEQLDAIMAAAKRAKEKGRPLNIRFFGYQRRGEYAFDYTNCCNYRYFSPENVETVRKFVIRAGVLEEDFF